MLHKEDLVHQSDQPVWNSSQSSKWLTIILLYVLLLTMFGLGGYWVGARQQQSSSTDLITIKPKPNWLYTVTPVQQLSPTPTNATGQACTATYWITHTDSRLSVRYPSCWRFRLFRYQLDGWYSISDDANYPQNEFRVSIEKAPSAEEVENATAEEVIEYVKNYEKSSTAYLGDYKPKEISKRQTTINGYAGIKYVFRLDNPQHLSYNHVTWVFVMHEKQLIKIYLQGRDQQLLDQILSTIKLLE